MRKGLYLFAILLVSAQVSAAAGFSVSTTKQVVFAPGNIQWHPKDSVWRFAPNQFDWCGNANLEMGNPDYDGWVDLLEWSIEGNNFGATAQYDTLLYCDKEFLDWGNLFPAAEKWYTLSKEEWNYLLSTRPDATDKYGIAMIGDTLGMIILPDEWEAPAGVEFVAQNTPTSELWDYADMIDDSYDHYRVKKDSMSANLFTEEDWAMLEANGAVFLPFAGRRSGGFGNYTNTKCETTGTMFRYSYYENYLGTYWTSSSSNPARGTAAYLYSFDYMGGDNYQWGSFVIWSENGRYGQSVRLARDINDIPTSMEAVAKENKSVRKEIRNGALYIIYEGKMYDVFGTQVK